MQKTTIPPYGKRGIYRISLIAILTIACLFSTNMFAQTNLEINLIKRSDSSIVQNQHFHLFEIVNTSSTTKSLDLKARNVSCSSAKKKQTDLDFLILNESRQNLNQIVLAPNQKLRFVLKTKRSEKTTLNAWNCIEVYAEDSKTKQSLSSDIIKSYIPNPTSFN